MQFIVHARRACVCRVPSANGPFFFFVVRVVDVAGKVSPLPIWHGFARTLLLGDLFAAINANIQLSLFPHRRAPLGWSCSYTTAGRCNPMGSSFRLAGEGHALLRAASGRAVVVRGGRMQARARGPFLIEHIAKTLHQIDESFGSLS
jgi:hypothetical protein